MMKKSLYDYCRENGQQYLLKEWHQKLNGELTPKQISYGSKKKVWWRCEHGHAWNSVVFNRTGADSGCPYCTGKKPWPGESDLASRRPDLAAEWHSTKNGNVTPKDVLEGSHYAAWWICDKGHEWQAMVKSRVSGSGCPYCANKKVLPGFNDLATLEPKIAAEWHPTLNGDLTPEQVTIGSHKKVWWQCSSGHVWQTVVYSRAGLGSHKSGCPVCTGRYKAKKMARYRLRVIEQQMPLKQVVSK